MPKVVAVSLRYAAKNYWFDPNGIKIEIGDHLIVETARGQEIGLCVECEKEVAQEDLVSPLKPVIRVAGTNDFAKADDLAKKSEDAFPIFCEMVEKNELDMKPIRVEFVFSADFATFYFSAEQRVDFRALVRDLASQFHVRIDMRQIGVRDEARILGGIGHCGEELCCHRFGAQVQQVSIRMAKDQDLPLSSNKISGQCGRLMCCLRYELEAYQDFKNRAPEKNAIIDTPLGKAKVVDYNTPAEIVNLLLEDGQSLSIPLNAMDTQGASQRAESGECVRPCHISQESLERALEELRNDKRLALMSQASFSTDQNLEDAVAKNPSAQHVPARRKDVALKSNKSTSRTPRSKHSLQNAGGAGAGSAAGAGDAAGAGSAAGVGGSGAGAHGAAGAQKHESGRALRKRRSVSVQKGAQLEHPSKNAEAKSQHNVNKADSGARGSKASKVPRTRTNSKNGANNKGDKDDKGQARPRPGQNSSSLSGSRRKRRSSRSL